MAVRMKRVYDAPSADDGLRVLVDRLWPRGMAKDKAKVDEWLKAIAPSNELRKWYGHVEERWPEFRRRYLAELEDPERAAALEHLRTLVREAEQGGAGTGAGSAGAGGIVTLLYSARATERNNATVLKEVLGRSTGHGRI